MGPNLLYIYQQYICLILLPTLRVRLKLEAFILKPFFSNITTNTMTKTDVATLLHVNFSCTTDVLFIHFYLVVFQNHLDQISSLVFSEMRQWLEFKANVASKRRQHSPAQRDKEIKIKALALKKKKPVAAL